MNRICVQQDCPVPWYVSDDRAARVKTLQGPLAKAPYSYPYCTCSAYGARIARTDGYRCCRYNCHNTQSAQQRAMILQLLCSAALYSAFSTGSQLLSRSHSRNSTAARCTTKSSRPILHRSSVSIIHISSFDDDIDDLSVSPDSRGAGRERFLRRWYKHARPRSLPILTRARARAVRCSQSWQRTDRLLLPSSSAA